MASLADLLCSLAKAAAVLERRLVEAARRSPQLAWLGRRLGWISELGTAGYGPEDRRRLKILNLIAALIAVTTGIYAVQFSIIDPVAYAPIILINVALLAMALLVPILHRFGPIAASLVVVACEYAAQVALSAYLGREAGLHLQLFVAMAAPFVVLGFERLRLVLAIAGLGLALHLLVWFRFPQHAALITADRGLIDGLYLQAAITTAGLIGATVWYAFHLVELAKGETDRLLRDVLPESVVERLKARPGEPIADAFEEASVLFADISGFVPLARRLGAPGVVALLNRLVSELDCLSARHGVEKIKTIGDAYMAASGLPEPGERHLERLAALALDMQKLVAELRAETGHDLHMRIGMAAGPVMAGIIGTQKFSYDVWGDTVNLAARLESIGVPGRILVCPQCRDRLDHAFEFEPRGTVDVKGLGPRETFFILRRKPAPARPVGRPPPERANQPR